MGGGPSKEQQQETNDKLEELIKLQREAGLRHQYGSLLSEHRNTVNRASKDKEVTQTHNGFSLVSINTATIATGIGIGSLLLLLAVLLAVYCWCRRRNKRKQRRRHDDIIELVSAPRDPPPPAAPAIASNAGEKPAPPVAIQGPATPAAGPPVPPQFLQQWPMPMGWSSGPPRYGYGFPSPPGMYQFPPQEMSGFGYYSGPPFEPRWSSRISTIDDEVLIHGRPARGRREAPPTPAQRSGPGVVPSRSGPTRVTIEEESEF
jgi:hypothetical protein